MKNTTYFITWILTHGPCNCNNSFNLWIFAKFQDEAKKYLIKLHFLSLNQVSKMVNKGDLPFSITIPFWQLRLLNFRLVEV